MLPTREMRLRDVGAHVCVPFPVRRIEGAGVLWLNERWFVGTGVDIRDPAIRVKIEQALLDEFAVSGPWGRPSLEGAADGDGILYADRYGSTSGSLQGGSGRCGVSGAFNAKGIGRTPLVGAGVDWYHSHGLMWMKEAIREAIASELCGAELPLGAVPVIAIIDGGRVRSQGDRPFDERRAIIVRPNFLRPAHFQRSIFFGTSGTEESDQIRDARRVEEIFRHVGAGGAGAEDFAGLTDMYLRIARQLGACRAHRLWLGRFFTGNMAIDGAFVDFGAFRAVQDWRRATAMTSQVFGADLQQLKGSIEDLHFYFRKFAADGPPREKPAEILAAVEKAIDTHFSQDCAAVALGEAAAHPCADALGRVFRDYFRRQQRETVYVSDPDSARPTPWLWDALSDDPAEALRAGEADRAAAAAIRAILAEAGRPWAVPRLRRWLQARPAMHYEVAVRHLQNFAEGMSGVLAEDAPRVADVIGEILSTSRRVWAGLPAGLEPLGQTVEPLSSVVYGFDHQHRRHRVMVTCSRLGDKLFLFDRTLALSDLAGLDAEIEDGQVRFVTDTDISALNQGAAITMAVGKIPLPRPRFLY